MLFSLLVSCKEGKQVSEVAFSLYVTCKEGKQGDQNYQRCLQRCPQAQGWVGHEARAEQLPAAQGVKNKVLQQQCLLAVGGAESLRLRRLEGVEEGMLEGPADEKEGSRTMISSAFDSGRRNLTGQAACAEGSTHLEGLYVQRQQQVLGGIQGSRGALGRLYEWKYNYII